MTQELIVAANTLGRFNSKVFGHRAPKEWTLLVVVSVERRGEKNTVKAEFLDSQRKETTGFTCFSPEPVFQVGDFVTMRGDEISFLYQVALTPITFRAGSSISLLEESGVQKSAPARDRPSALLSGPVLLNPRKKKAHRSSYEMTESELVHYHSDAVSIADLCAKLKPVVKAYARTNTRKPRDVAPKLNGDGYRTACGARWTPRLTYFLLALLFSDAKASPTNRARGTGGASTSTEPETIRLEKSKQGVAPLTQTELARRLSRLGRVVVTRQ